MLAVEAETVKLLVLRATVSGGLVELTAVVVAPDATRGAGADSDAVGEEIVTRVGASDVAVTFAVVAARAARVEPAGALTFMPVVASAATAAAAVVAVETVVGGTATVEPVRGAETVLAAVAFKVAGLSPAAASEVLETVGRAVAMATISDEVPFEAWGVTAGAAAAPTNNTVVVAGVAAPSAVGRATATTDVAGTVTDVAAASAGAATATTGTAVTAGAVVAASAAGTGAATAGAATAAAGAATAVDVARTTVGVVTTAAGVATAMVGGTPAVMLPVGDALKLGKPTIGAAAVATMEDATAAALLLVAAGVAAMSTTVAIYAGWVVEMVDATAMATVDAAAVGATEEAETAGAATVAATEVAFSTGADGATELRFVEVLNAAVLAATNHSIVSVALFVVPA